MVSSLKLSCKFLSNIDQYTEICSLNSIFANPLLNLIYLLACHLIYHQTTVAKTQLFITSNVNCCGVFFLIFKQEKNKIKLFFLTNTEIPAE